MHCPNGDSQQEIQTHHERAGCVNPRENIEVSLKVSASWKMVRSFHQCLAGSGDWVIVDCANQGQRKSALSWRLHNTPDGDGSVHCRFTWYCLNSTHISCRSPMLLPEESECDLSCSSSCYGRANQSSERAAFCMCPFRYVSMKLILVCVGSEHGGLLIFLCMPGQRRTLPQQGCWFPPSLNLFFPWFHFELLPKPISHSPPAPWLHCVLFPWCCRCSHLLVPWFHVPNFRQTFP